MPALSHVSIQPLDITLFRGIDPVSHAICFFEGRMFGHGEFSHAGVAVTREALDRRSWSRAGSTCGNRR